MADHKAPPPLQWLERDTIENSAESMVNLTLLDPSRWGWTAGGGVADLLPPHEVRRMNLTGIVELQC
jgi:hypothetical protein